MRKPQLTAKIMRPEHPRRPELYQSLKQAFQTKLKQGRQDESSPGLSATGARKILLEMGFSEFDCDVTILYLIKRWLLDV
jgi:hypothetical protein